MLRAFFCWVYERIVAVEWELVGWALSPSAGWQPFAERSAAKGWLANVSAIPFGCAEKAATLENVTLMQIF